MSNLSLNAHQTGRPPTTLNFAPPFIIRPGAAAGDPIAGSRSKTGRIRRSAGCRISSETAPAQAMRRFEVPEDNGFIAECVRLLGLRIRQKTSC